MSEATPQQPRKKNWLCIFPGCTQKPMCHYNAYSHCWDGHLRHLASPLIGGGKAEVYKKLNNREEVKKQCEIYLVEIKSDEDVENQRTVARQRLGNPQLSITVEQPQIIDQSDNSLQFQQPMTLQNISNNSNNSALNNLNGLNTMNTLNSPLVNNSINNFGLNPDQLNVQDSNLSVQQLMIPQTQETPLWDCVVNANVYQKDLEALLQHDQFVRIEQITENLKRLHVAGEVLAENGFLQRSDARSKDHIEPLKNCLNTILQLTGKSYKYIGKDDQKMGFIAQEVQDVCPNLVHEDELGLSVDVVGIIPLLVEALKEIQTAASKTADCSNGKFAELSLAADEALAAVKEIGEKVQKDEDEMKKHLGFFALEESVFSPGPALFTLLVAMVLSVLSVGVVVVFQKLIGMWLYVWGITALLWICVWWQRWELKEIYQHRHVVWYWKSENSLFLYYSSYIFFIFLSLSLIMGKGVITLVGVSVGLLIITCGILYWVTKKFKLGWKIPTLTLVLLLTSFVIVSSTLIIIQPEYQCTLNGESDGYEMHLNVGEMSEKVVVNSVPWNCWIADMFNSNELPGGMKWSNGDTSPFLEGYISENFKTFSTQVRLQCVELVTFNCGEITFKTCTGREEPNDCRENGCKWDDDEMNCSF
ncbi:hypothetical protein EIN_252860 [Entamoeba invadens IP1]|uniref:Peptidase S74 domain-containing protein n=1 Tax=Entamoeba invadens IP1 TaxID=370355 RepID=A0A0A1UHB7_ENTIV|nr:hypothetical protein EIN_252860 [Entamoeba invadens IP1]ELP95042.1 hypothetical protein EIN_252860 [Entamoeba invadens IP1]|eukprot:XP_004261813.1 hypothetical protein EIN_252860 [Entamoeba invadens IP1]